MPMTLVRHPRAARRIHPQVIKDIEPVYDALAKTSVATLEDEISDWEHQPEFKYKVSVSRKKWQITIYWDRRTKAGQIYDWVKEGTGERGHDPAGTTYFIRPKKAKSLKFGVPLVTKTTSDFGVAPSTTWEPGVIYTQVVKAPGIFPRDLGKELYTHLKSSKPGSFRNVTEASIKRSFRKMGIYVG